MKEGPDISRLAALIGDPARANMLTALIDGRSLTAGELARVAGVTVQTASGHLAKLKDGGLLQGRKQGRHRYFALADGDVAATLEALMGLAAGRGASRIRPGPKDAQMRMARVCYNHLAGQMGVEMFDSLRQRHLISEVGETVSLTNAGADFARGFGIDVDALEKSRTPLCRSCLDWSERRSHLAGSLGRALLSHMESIGWMRRDATTRTLYVSDEGQVAFASAFPVIKP